MLAVSIRATARVDTDIVFVCTPGDDDQIAACEATDETTLVTEWEGGQGDYARKINLGLSATEADWIFTGADDLQFTDGWDETTIAAGDRGAGVVGTVDGCNPRTRRAQHSTHSLVARWYAVEYGTVEARPAIYHEGYWHNFCDDEMVGTAIARRAYSPSTALVQHLHPMAGKADMDDTYRLGLQHFQEDRETFGRRRRMWRTRLKHAARSAP